MKLQVVPSRRFGWAGGRFGRLVHTLIKFLYRPEAQPSLGWEHRRDCGTATRGELLWYFFPGDVDIVTDEGTIEMGFGWVPVLHFGLGLLGATESLSSDGALDQYTFTEADESVTFERRGDRVHIWCSYSPEQVTTTYGEFKLGSQSFMKKTLDDLEARHPSLLSNPAFRDIRDSLGPGGAMDSQADTSGVP